MEFIQTFLPIAAVVVICVLIGMYLKWRFEGDERKSASIPWILALCGAALGIIAKFIMPEYAEYDILTALAVGIVSGLAAGGAYQVIHQYKKLDK